MGSAALQLQVRLQAQPGYSSAAAAEGSRELRLCCNTGAQDDGISVLDPDPPAKHLSSPVSGLIPQWDEAMPPDGG